MDLVGAEWRKSSFSGSAEDCVEVAFIPAEWRKSSFSGTAEDCVEVALVPGTTAVRDTKARSGGTLTFSASSWASFTRLTSR